MDRFKIIRRILMTFLVLIVSNIIYTNAIFAIPYLDDDPLHQLPAIYGRISWFSSAESGLPGAWGEWLGENLGANEGTKYWYCAMRWPYWDPNTGFFNQDAKNWWHDKKILVTNPANGNQVILLVKDWGPSETTGRVLDVSFTALEALEAKTDNEVNIEFADQNASLGPPPSKKFNPGDNVIVIWNELNIRDNPGGSPIQGSPLLKDSKGKVLLHSNNGRYVYLPEVGKWYYWWYVEITDKEDNKTYVGWVTEDGIERLGVDVVLVIDRSGSMDYECDFWGCYYTDKMQKAKNSAKMFVDLMEVGDKIGVVDFDHIVSVTYPLTRIDQSSSTKAAAKNAIDSLWARGNTSIGGGLQSGQDQLITRGENDPVWAMILLSDGWENTGPMVKDVLPNILGTKTRIYTIGLGTGADESLLNTIALLTGGFYRFSPSGAELGTIYQDIQRAIGGFQGIASFVTNIFQGVTKAFLVGIDSNVLRAFFRATIGGSDVDMILIKPDGTIVNPSVAATDRNIIFTSGTNYKSYEVLFPMPGTWQIIVTGTDIPPGGEILTVNVSGSTDITLSIDFDKIEYIPNESIVVYAQLKDSLGPLTGASVVAEIQTPFTTEMLTLFDDGMHGDGAANDGIYANYYTNTSQRGSYTFKVDALGTSRTGEAFTRTATKSTVVGRDSDNDGMPDAWEDIYGLDKYRDDSGEDPDNDSLTNIQEYTYRTNPKNPDTDGDGYSDGHEVKAGSDPLDPKSIPKIKGDLDNDGDVDQNNLNILLSYRNKPASACPACDLDGDGMITVLDARKLVLLCTRPKCATQ